MKRLLLLLLIGFLAACSLTPRGTSPSRNGPRVNVEKRYVEGRAVVGYAEGASAARLAAAVGGQVLEDWKPMKAALIGLPKGMSVEKAIAILERLAKVRYAEPDRLFEKPRPAVNATGLTGIQTLSDPELGKQWMHRQLHTPAAWRLGITGKGIRIGIHDDFMDFTHPDLRANIAYPGFYGTTGKLICPDTPHNGQGTHATSVAGTAAAAKNGIGGRGVAYQAQLVPLAIDHPTEGFLTLSGIINAGLFAAFGPELFGLSVPAGCGGYSPPAGRPYVDVVNMSWGGGAYDQAVKDVMDVMLSTGVVLVTSAGNTPTTGFAEPAWYPGLITVAATKPTGERTDFSNRGKHLDVAAPGERIWAPTTRACVLADPTGASCPPDAADYIYISGTSFSSPATAGVAALILDAVAERDASGNVTGIPLDAAQVRQILTQTAWDANADTEPGFDEDLGWGIVDAEAAVKRALAIKSGEASPPPEGTNLTVFVYDKNTGTPLPLTSVTLIPVDPSGQVRGPFLLAQTTGSGVLADAGRAYFLQIDPGRYRVLVSGPHKKTGVAPGLAEGTFDLTPGYHVLQVGLDVQLPQDPYEPNDTLATATPAAAGKTYVGILYASSGSDDDYYRVPVAAGKTYVFNTETVSGTADLVLELYAPDGSLLDSNDNNQSFSTDARLRYAAADDGEVIVRVYDKNGGSSPFNVYALDITTDAGSESEPNGSATVHGTTISAVDVSSANPLGVGETISAELDPKGDDDVFAVVMQAGVAVAIDVETVESGVPDTLIAVYDGGGNELAKNDDFTGRESRLTFTPPADGTYYVLVTSWDGDGPDGTTGPYELGVSALDTP